MGIFVDTNVLVCLFNADTPTQQERAHEVANELARDSRLVVSSQVLSELYVSVTRKPAHPLEPAAAQRALADLAAYPVVAVDAARMRARSASTSCPSGSASTRSPWSKSTPSPAPAAIP